MTQATETMQFQTEVNQLLKLMIHSLYSNREIFLRELISNASDALDKRRFLGVTDASLMDGAANLQIDIAFDAQAKTITINDNGVGMNRAEVIENIGTIAKSGTKAFLEKLEADQKSASAMIGQFGVGFYSAFIVADEVELITRKAGDPADAAVVWRSKGEADFSLAATSKASAGTSIVLHLREDHHDLLNEWTLKNIIKKYSDHIAFPVMMTVEKTITEPAEEGQEASTRTETEVEQINQATSLWQRAKKDISDEEYQSFYKAMTHDYQAPLTWAHNQVEGKVSYTSLLYVPSKAPMGLWEQKATHGVQLYVQRVFIMDGAEKLMPRYLRFVKGVIDAQDLPLNVSREILQSSSTIDAIRQGATKRVLGMLETMSKDKPDDYKAFWAEFGRVLKEGVGEDMANRDALLKLFRFSSSKEDAPIVSLADYVGRMGEKQDKIYFLTADSLNHAKNSPHLEVFKQRGIEVLLMTEVVDDWMMGFIYEYEGKSFVNVAKGDIQLDGDDAAKPDTETPESPLDAALIERMKAALSEHVDQVKVSKRLTDSVACLVRSEHAMSAHFERMLKDAGHSVPSTKPWLEINMKHPLIEKLATLPEGDANAQDLALLVYEQATLLEGSQLADPAGFVARLNRLMK
jgi:molecular chaperone HtpG